LAKIAVELDRALARRAAEGTRGHAAPRILARGDGWTVADVVCTSGPEDRSFEEQHTHYAIAIVVAGTFQYRSSLGGGVMTPGGLMLGNPGQCYECGHQHGRGDRCVSFWYAPDYFERLARDWGGRGAGLGFRVPRLPPLRVFSPLIARAADGALDSDGVAWEEIGVALAARAAGPGTAADGADDRGLPANAVARVTQTVRLIERHPDARLSLGRLARDARLSPYHFLRTFERLTGVTPHQFILRARLREAALRLVNETGSVLDLAFDCGFGDVSNFNRAFRAEFGVSPRVYRRARAGRLASSDPWPKPRDAGPGARRW
jgi:AraC family transcriptional regulator